jgi:hypothetical protein
MARPMPASRVRPETLPRRFGKCALTLAMAATVLACSTAGPSTATAGSLGSLNVVGRDGRLLPIHRAAGRNWVVGAPGQEYSVRVCNTTGGRMLAVVSVDGVNVVSGDTAAPSQPGYVLRPYECTDIDGWRTSLMQTAAFYFTALPDAYAARTGRPDNVGVIGVAWFTEKRPSIAWRDRPAAAIGEMRHDAGVAPSQADAAPAPERAAGATGGPARDEAAMPSAPLAKLGTGYGRAQDSPTRLVGFERASPTPAETIAIHYDRRENLIAMGILPPPVVARVPDPFPGWSPRFVPAPPR